MKLVASIIASVAFAAYGADAPVSFKLVKSGDTQKQLIAAYPDTRCVALRKLVRCELRKQSWAELDAAFVSFFVIDGLIERISVQLQADDWDKAIAVLRSRHGNPSNTEPVRATEDELAREAWALSGGATTRAQKFGGRTPFALVTMSTAKALKLEAEARAQREAEPKPDM